MSRGRGLAILMAILCPFLAYAQSTSVTLHGRVLDAFTYDPIPNVTVQLLTPDSTVVAQTATVLLDENTWRRTNYEIEAPKVGKYLLKCSMVGYKTRYQPIVLKGKRLSRTEIPAIVLHEDVTKLDEALVTATRVKMLIKGDTVEFNADAFRLAKGSMLDQLLKQLPGVEIRNGNQIVLNGRPVKSLLLNGRDLSSSDAKSLRQNLPAYMIGSVKAYDKEQDDAYITGNVGQTQEKPLVLDIGLKKAYSIGWVANAEAGAGTEQRYAGRAFGLRFTDRSRLTLTGLLNNTNDTRVPGEQGDDARKAIRLDNGGQYNIRQGAISYNTDNKTKEVELALSGSAESRERNVESISSGANFLPGGDVYRRGRMRAKTDNLLLTGEGKLQIRKPKFFWRTDLKMSYNTLDTRSGREAVQLTSERSERTRGAILDSVWSDPFVGSASLLGDIVHRQQDKEQGRGKTFSAEMSHIASVKLSGTDDLLRLNATSSLERNSDLAHKHLDLRYGEASGGTSDFRNLYSDRSGLEHKHRLGASYDWRNLRTKFAITPSYELAYRHKQDDYTLYRLDRYADWRAGSPLMSLPTGADVLEATRDRANSSQFTLRELSHTLAFNLSLWGLFANEKKNFNGGNLNIYLPIRLDQTAFEYQRNGSFPTLRRDRWSFNPNIYYISSPLMVFYRFERQQIYEPMYLFDIVDDSDPLVRRYGSPELRTPFVHSLYTYLRLNSKERSSNLNINLRLTLTEDAITLAQRYDRLSGRTVLHAQNVGGNWTGNVEIPWNKLLGKDKAWQLSPRISYTFVNSVDLVSTDMQGDLMRSAVQSHITTAKFDLNYRKGALALGLTTSADWRISTSQRTDFRRINALEYKYGLTLTTPIVWGVELSSDLTMFGRRGYNDRNLNSDNLVWNARLSKGFLADRLTLMVDGFDLLRQLPNIQHTVNAQGRTETWYNVVPNYIMLRLGYRFSYNPEGKKSKKAFNNIIYMD